MLISRTELDAAVFDMDGVLTRTASLHRQAWKQVFDDLLSERARAEGVPFRPFEEEDYLRYVDGIPRYDGVESFLRSRGIRLPRGEEGGKAADERTVLGLAARKNLLFWALLRERGVEVFEGAVALVRRMRAAGFRTAVISASKNCGEVLRAAHLDTLFDARVDGVEQERLGLQGKPAPDVFLEAARRLGVPPERSVAIEDALAGVRAGRAAGFGLVIGVARGAAPEELQAAGADVVVSHLASVHLEPEPEARTWTPGEEHP